MHAVFAWTPETLAKTVNFVLVVILAVWGWRKYGTPMLLAHQAAQNAALQEAEAARESASQALDAAQQRVVKAQADALTIVADTREQAAGLVTAERAKAREREQRMLAHAKGELQRERYRVRQELLRLTVERAYVKAVEILRREIGEQDQRRLIEDFVRGLEAQHSV